MYKHWLWQENELAPGVSYGLAVQDNKVIGEQLKCTRLDKNAKDCYIVAVLSTTAVSTEILGHIPWCWKISQNVSQLLSNP